MSRSLKVLVVEDEEMLLEIISFHLLEAGYDVIEASHGKEALEKFIKEDIDTLLTDIHMPIMSGFELMEKILAHRFLPVILFTGFSDIAPCILRNAGAMKILPKPLDFNAIVEMLFSINHPPSQIFKPIKILQDKVSLTSSTVHSRIYFGQHGFYLTSDQHKLNPGEHIQFDFLILPENKKVTGIGEVFLVNDSRYEPEKERRGVMIDILSLTSSADEYQSLIVNENQKRSIPFKGSPMNKYKKGVI